MIVTVAAKRIEGSWEGALIVDGRFSRGLKGKLLATEISRLIAPFLAHERPDETEVTINIAINEPEVKPS